MVKSADRVVEWVAFHRLVGYSHFFVYVHRPLRDRQMLGRLGATLRPHYGDDVVTIIDWPEPSPATHPDFTNDWTLVQIAANNHCIRRYGALASWMTVHDVDEYMLPLALGPPQQQQQRRDDDVNGADPLPNIVALLDAIPQGDHTHLAAYSWFYSGPPADPTGTLLSAWTRRRATYETDGFTKVFFRPSQIDIHAVHHIAAPPERPRFLDPFKELRMFHFKANADKYGPVDGSADTISIAAYSAHVDRELARRQGI